MATMVFAQTSIPTARNVMSRAYAPSAQTVRCQVTSSRVTWASQAVRLTPMLLTPFANNVKLDTHSVKLPHHALTVRLEVCRSEVDRMRFHHWALWTVPLVGTMTAFRILISPALHAPVIRWSQIMVRHVWTFQPDVIQLIPPAQPTVRLAHRATPNRLMAHVLTAP